MRAYYARYAQWCKDSSEQALAKVHFGRVLAQQLKVERVRCREGEQRHYVYHLGAKKVREALAALAL